MATLVLTIATEAPPWQTVAPSVQELLLAWVPKAAVAETERDRLRASAIAQRTYSPWTATLSALALYDVERAERVLYRTAAHGIQTPADVCTYERTEATILEAFWNGAEQYDTFVTYNGRRFLVPFLLQRSAVCGVRPTVNLLEGRRLEHQRGVRHVDLLDQVTYYGAQNRRPSLALLAHAYGIELSQQALDPAVADLEVVAALYQNWLHYQADIGTPLIDFDP